MTSRPVRKLANAFVPHARLSEAVPTAALPALDRFERKHGGLWVGGTVSISERGVSFSPNGLNRAFHVGLDPITVPAADVRAVKHEFGWFTGIVVVEHAEGEFRFRCYGAKRLAASMAARFGGARPGREPKQAGT